MQAFALPTMRWVMALVMLAWAPLHCACAWAAPAESAAQAHAAPADDAHGCCRLNDAAPHAPASQPTEHDGHEDCCCTGHAKAEAPQHEAVLVPADAAPAPLLLLAPGLLPELDAPTRPAIATRFAPTAAPLRTLLAQRCLLRH